MASLMIKDAKSIEAIRIHKAQMEVFQEEIERIQMMAQKRSLDLINSLAKQHGGDPQLAQALDVRFLDPHGVAFIIMQEPEPKELKGAPEGEMIQ